MMLPIFRIFEIAIGNKVAIFLLDFYNLIKILSIWLLMMEHFFVNLYVVIT